ncbi:MAG: GIY-YIG nuclease family protein [Salinimicrobium sp.]
MHFLYILYSKTANRYYVGETADLENRFQNHIDHKYKQGFTKAAEDWKVVLELKLDSKADALFLESFIKRMKSKIFTEKIIQNPSILQDILKNR